MIRRAIRQMKLTASTVAVITIEAILVHGIGVAHVQAGPLTDIVLNDSELSFAVVHFSGPVTQTSTLGNSPFLVNWDFNISAMESQRPGIVNVSDSDGLTISGNFQHENPPLEPPHGENPGTRQPFDFEPIAVPVPGNLLPGNHLQTKSVGISHEHHRDDFASYLAFGVALVGPIAAQDSEITGYVVISSGSHTIPKTTEEEHARAFGMLSPTSAALSSFGNSIGGVELLVDPANGNVSATFAASNLSLQDVTAVHIRGGHGDTPGPILFTLAPNALQSVGDGVGIAGFLSGEVLSPDAREMILAGNAYAEIATTDFPGGALRGSIARQAVAPLLGDLNGDRAFDNFDILPFELALTDPEAFELQFPNVDPAIVGDVNQDGAFNNFDIAAFEQLLTGAGADASSVNVPEPGALIVLAPLVLNLSRRRRP